MIEVDLSNPWLAIGVGVFVLLTLIVALIARRAPAPALPIASDPAVVVLTARVSTLEAKHAATDDKVGHIDHDVRNIRSIVGNLPTKDSIAAIGSAVAESRGQITGMQASLTALTHSNGRIEDFLLKVAGEALVDRAQEKKRGLTSEQA